MISYISIDELDVFAIRFWKLVKDAKVFAFYGEMGAGKTTIIGALCKQKGVKEGISSPTFSIINEYIFFQENKERKIYHLDLYRLNSMEEIVQAGVEDCLYSGDICFVEWPEKAPQLLPENTVRVFVKITELTQRQVKIETPAAS